MPGVEGAVLIDVGGAHACAVLADSSVRCWGSNRRGQLGNPGGGSGLGVVVVLVDARVAI